MPYLTLEVSSDLACSADAMLDAVISTCLSSDLFENSVLMARAVVYDKFRVAQRGVSGFANLSLRMRPGRSADSRVNLSEALVTALVDITQRNHPGRITCLTCEIHEVNTEARALRFVGESS